MIRGMNAQAQTAWFYRQLICLAEERPLELGLSGRGALLRHYVNEFRLSRARVHRKTAN
jgi:hypothetical protein